MNIRDSYLLLPSSLRLLSLSFGVISKSFFPFTFFNEGLNPLDYKGARPGFKYYEESGISRKDYDTLVSSQAEGFIWNAEAEAKEYCIRAALTPLHPLAPPYGGRGLLFHHQPLPEDPRWYSLRKYDRRRQEYLETDH